MPIDHLKGNLRQFCLANETQGIVGVSVSLQRLKRRMPMAPGFQRFVSTLLFALMSSLALPASAMDWPYWRAGDLKRGVETLSTRQDASHTVAISVCAPGEAFVCLRFSSSGGLAVPKGKKLPESWEFEGWRYQVVERNASLMLLGELVEGYTSAHRPLTTMHLNSFTHPPVASSCFK